MHCGGAIADPEAGGRPGQDGSAGCDQPGAAASGRRAGGRLGPSCIVAGWAGLKFEQAVHYIVLEDYIAAVEAAEARRDRLTAQIDAMLPDWTLAPVVAALQTMRGMALVNAATLIAELGGLPRFANPRQLMAYLGLVPSEHSSGANVKRGGLTKSGNSAAHRLLIEAA
jgi:transposase